VFWIFFVPHTIRRITFSLFQVFYGSFAWAAANCSTLNDQAGGLGTFMYLLTFVCIQSMVECATVSVIISMIIGAVNSEDEAFYLVSSAKWELRLPYFLFALGCTSSCVIPLLEGSSRYFLLDQGVGLGPPKDAVDWDRNGPAMAAGGACFILFFGLMAPTASLVAKQRSAHEAFAYDLSKNMALESWYASPSMQELRALADEYFGEAPPASAAAEPPRGSSLDRKAKSADGGMANPNPSHFTRFVTHRMREKGHGSLTYICLRQIDVLFEEHAQKALSAAD